MTPSHERVKWYSERLPSHLKRNSFFPDPRRTTLRNSSGSFFHGVVGFSLYCLSRVPNIIWKNDAVAVPTIARAPSPSGLSGSTTIFASSNSWLEPSPPHDGQAP